MNRSELKKFFINTFSNTKLISCFQIVNSRYPEIRDNLINETNYLSNTSTFNERLYNIINDIDKVVTCKMCLETVRFINFNIGYNKYCSKKCSYKDKDLINKRKNTNLKKYGSVSPIGNKKIKEKIENTNLKKYGVKNVSQSKDIQDKKKDKSLNTYGTEYVFQAEEVKNKIKESNIKKYGVENPMKNNIIKEKTKNTNLKKYGYKCALQNLDVNEKSKTAMIKKYGVVRSRKSITIKRTLRKIKKYKY